MGLHLDPPGSGAMLFNPEVYEERGFLFYRDGSVHGDLQIGSGGELEIWSWYSAAQGAGNTTRALSWLRAEGYVRIVVVDATSDAMKYWNHMMAKGLVDEVRPEPLASSPSSAKLKGGPR